MKRHLTIFVFTALLAMPVVAQDFKADTGALIESSCIQCHDESTDTDLNFESLGYDLSDSDTFGMWERIFDRTSAGEMPPESEDRPNVDELKATLSSLKTALHTASVHKQQTAGRVPGRRLTKLEFGYTLQDLLLIENNITNGIPDEVDAGTFDTVGSNQRISAVHLESYLDAVDEALEHAMQFGRNPYHDYGDLAVNNFVYLEPWHKKPAQEGGSITRKLKFGKGFVLFRDVDYLTHFTSGIRRPGIHRLTAKVAAVQSKKAITAKIIIKHPSGSARLAKSVDLHPGKPQMISCDTFLKPGDAPYLTWDSGMNFQIFTIGAMNYTGPGMAVMSQKVEGPIYSSWPSPSMNRLFKSMEPYSDGGQVKLKYSKKVIEHVEELLCDLAPRVFRRDVSADEVKTHVDLAKPVLDEGRYLRDAFKVSMRSMLTAPQFLMFEEQPGKLDDFALANRLSYFLWKSMPDEELFEMARTGSLSDKEVLSRQIERMLSNGKADRFVRDFLGQWLWVHKINATTPDDGLYPEFDELLSTALPQETQLFFAELIKENMSLTNLIDSNFTFLNRRLAQHYKIGGVEGTHFRKVELPVASRRGGVLTQAAILKTTANGTTTSPVMRGNFVLTNFLGTPPSPPPPGIGSIEPDTRGKTTVREILKAHREMESCNQCHREIDPPGFALESFDPIGGFRTHYRADGGTSEIGGFPFKNPPRRGPAVDSSGTTSDGESFADINEFKRHLLDDKEQIARNFISKLTVYATGAEIQFADREKIESILKRTALDDYPVRDIIHEVVQSELFRNK